MPDEDALDVEEATEETAEEKKDLATRLKESVDVEVADAGTLRKRLTIRVPRTTIDEEQAEQIDELSRDAFVPGFRKGRAPRALIVKRFGRDVNEQIKTELLSRGYAAAVEKANLKVLGDPRISLTGDDGSERLVSVEEAFDQIELPASEPMTFVCEVEVRPEFDLPALEGIELKKPKVQITEEDVDQHIDRLRGLRGTFEPVIGKVQADDMVVADVTLTLDGREVKKEENVQLAARAQQIDHIPVAGLGEAVVGKRAGDRTFVEVDVPKDHPSADWRGKSARFDILVHDVKRLSLPEIDADFLSSLGFDTPEELRDWVREDMNVRLGDAIRDGLRNQVYEYLLKNILIDLPEGLSHRQAERVADRRMINLRRRGVPEAEIAKQLDGLRVEAKDEAVRDLKMFFVMEKLSEELDLHVGEDEINGQIALMAQRYGRRFDRMRDELARGEGLANLYLHLRDEKIVDWLITKAQITETEGPKKKSAGKRSKAKDSTTPPAAAEGKKED